MVSQLTIPSHMALDTSRTPVLQRVLIVDPDPQTLDQLVELMGSYPVPIEPLDAGSTREALRILNSSEAIDCLLVDVSHPGLDGFQLLISARERKRPLRIVAMSSAASADLHRAALESGADCVLSKPFDFEDLMAALAPGRPGSVSYLEGAFDVIDICQLSAACLQEGGLKIVAEDQQGVVAHHGDCLVHVAVGNLTGAPALAALRAWKSWSFESISLAAANLTPSCKLELAGCASPTSGKSSGFLRGLTLRHLIEWALRARQTCTMTVTSLGRTGVLSFKGGRIRSAETLDREEGRAAAEILSWENVLVNLTRVPEAASVARPVKGGGMLEVMDRFRGEIQGLIATSVIRLRDGSLVAGHAADARISPPATCAFVKVVEGHLAALKHLGVEKTWGVTEDLLITTERAYLLIRLLGQDHCHWLAVSNEANPALCRLMMRSFEPFLLTALADSGELPEP